MELTQQDYEERINRRAAGQSDDEDLRLIKHYEEQGYSTRDDSVGKRAPSVDDQRSTGAPSGVDPVTGGSVVKTEAGSGVDAKPAKATAPARGDRTAKRDN